MAINSDFRDLYAALNDVGARYLLVGGHAVAFHAQPRFTKDIDIWIDPAADNAAAVFRALDAFGAPLGALRAQDLSTEGTVFQIGDVIGREHLRKNKLAMARPQDLLDADLLK